MYHNRKWTVIKQAMKEHWNCSSQVCVKITGFFQLNASSNVNFSQGCNRIPKNPQRFQNGGMGMNYVGINKKYERARTKQNQGGNILC